MDALGGNIVIFATHHKVGTALMGQVCNRLTGRAGLPFVNCPVDEVLSGLSYGRLDSSCIVLDDHSRLDAGRLALPVKTVHFIRDPREVVVSGYLFHLKCSETWCITPHPKYRGLSYQKLIKSLPRDEGIMQEIELVARGTLRDMIGWRAAAGAALEMKFEEILENFDQAFRNIFNFAFGPGSTMTDRCMEAIADSDLRRQPMQDRQANGHITNYELKQGRWREFLNPQHRALLKERYGDFILSQGYERTPDW